MEVIINESFYIRKLKDGYSNGYRLAMVKKSLTSIVIVIRTQFEHTEVTHIFIQFDSVWHEKAFKQVNPTDININLSSLLSALLSSTIGENLLTLVSLPVCVYFQ